MVEVFCGILAGANYGPNIRSWKSTSTAANLVRALFLIEVNELLLNNSFDYCL